MSNEIVKYKWQEKEIALTKSDVRNLISTDPKVTDKEIALFMQLCKYQSLNPFVREVYLVKYGTYPASMVVGKEVFTKRAENNPNFDGYDFKDNYKVGMNYYEFEVTCIIYRKNLTHPITVTVSYPEYVGTDGKGNINRMWKGKPRTMLRKVALMQGLREAFPTALGGLYEENELDQRAVPKDITPKEESKEEIDKQIEKVFPKEEAAEEDVISDEQAKVIEAEVEHAEAIEAEQEQEDHPVHFNPASDKQKDFIYGIGDKKGIVHSEYITDKEVKHIGKKEDLDIAKASKILAWWWGNKDKNVIGEREKRENNPKIGKNALEVRGILMEEVLGLMKKNYIKEAEKKKMYKKYQKNAIQNLATEELEELKVLLENYTPDWS